MKIDHCSRRLFAAVSAVIAAVVCAGVSCEAAYKPDFVPLTVSINERGELSVAFDGQIVTPIGTFTLAVTPHNSMDPGDDILFAIDHLLRGEPVESIFRLRDLGKGSGEISVNGGSGTKKTGDRKKPRISVPPGPQRFTVGVKDDDEVRAPSTTSSTTWSESAPTSGPTTTTTTTTTTPSSTTVPSSSPTVSVTSRQPRITTLTSR